MAIQVVFWDYDNTILATAEAHWQKHKEVLDRLGIPLHEIYRKKIYENNGSQNWDWMQQELGLSLSEEMYLQAIDKEFYKHMISLQMRPGVSHLLNFLKQEGIPQAIVTNARKQSAQRILEEKKISSYMDLILYKEDYSGRKPDPQPYLTGMKKMEEILNAAILPRCCIVIEDDPKGVESAHRAGAFVIQRKLTEKEPDCPYADVCCFHEEDFLKIMKDRLQPNEL